MFSLKFTQNRKVYIYLIFTVPFLSFLLIDHPTILEPYIYGKILNIQNPDLFNNDYYLQSTNISGPYNNFCFMFTHIPMKLIPSFFYGIWLSIIYYYLLWIYKYIKFYFNFNNKLYLPISIIVLTLHLATIKSYSWGGFLVGDNEFIYSMLKPQSLSIILCLWSLLFLNEKKYFISFLLVGIGGLFHINTLQHFLIIHFIYIFANHSFHRNYKTISLCFFSITPLFFLSAYPFIKAELFNLNLSNYIDISCFFRHPHHFIVSGWNKIEFIIFIFFILAAIYCNRFNIIKDNLFKVLLILTIVLFIISYFSIEIFKVDLVAKFQFYRFPIYLKPFILIFVTVGIVRYFNYKNISFILLSIFILLIPLARGKLGSVDLNLPSNPRYLSINKTTDIDTIFIIPPLMNHNEITDFLLNARRSIYFDFSRYPFNKGSETIWISKIYEPPFEKLPVLEHERCIKEFYELNKRWNAIKE